MTALRLDQQLSIYELKGASNAAPGITKGLHIVFNICNA